MSTSVAHQKKSPGVLALTPGATIHFQIDSRMAALSGGGEGVRDRNADLEDACDRHRAFGLHQLGECPSLDQLHREEGVLTNRLEAVDGDDARVPECGERLRFAFEACPAFGILNHFRQQDLERDGPTETIVSCLVHLAHPTTTEESFKVVLAERGS